MTNFNKVFQTVLDSHAQGSTDDPHDRPGRDITMLKITTVNITQSPPRIFKFYPISLLVQFVIFYIFVNLI